MGAGVPLMRESVPVVLVGVGVPGEVLFWAVGGRVLRVYYWEEWHSTTAEEADGGPRVAAVAELDGF